MMNRLFRPNLKAHAVARDRDEWPDVTASFSVICVPIAEFLRRPTLGRNLEGTRVQLP
jgi:hypothetical protein